MSKDIEAKSFCSPNPVTKMSMTWVCGCSLAGTAGSNTVGYYTSVSCECCL